MGLEKGSSQLLVRGGSFGLGEAGAQERWSARAGLGLDPELASTPQADPQWLRVVIQAWSISLHLIGDKA